MNIIIIIIVIIVIITNFSASECVRQFCGAGAWRVNRVGFQGIFWNLQGIFWNSFRLQITTSIIKWPHIWLKICKSSRQTLFPLPPPCNALLLDHYSISIISEIKYWPIKSFLFFQRDYYLAGMGSILAHFWRDSLNILMLITKVSASLGNSMTH